MPIDEVQGLEIRETLTKVVSTELNAISSEEIDQLGESPETRVPRGQFSEAFDKNMMG